MSIVNITDFFLKLGFDGKEVEKGLDKMEKRVKALSKTIVGSTKKQNALAREEISHQVKLEELAIRKKAKILSANAAQIRGVDQLAAAQARAAGIADKAANKSKAKGGPIVGPFKEDFKQAQQEQRIMNRRNQLLAKTTDRLTKLDIRWGSNRESIIKNAKAFTKNRAAAEKFADSIGDVKKELEGLQKRTKAIKSAQGLKVLSGQLDKAALASTNLTLRQRILNREFSKGRFIMSAFKSALPIAGTAALGLAAFNAGKAFTRTGMELQALKASMLGASGSSEQAAKDFEFVKETSSTLGLSLTEAARGYSKIGAAARASGLDVEASRELFTGASEIATAFSLSGEESAGIQRAFTQILSKGKVSTEELLQIGERIPGTMAQAAKSLGMGTQEMLKLIESGKLMANDFLPGFVKSMRASIRETGQLEKGLKTSRTAMNRMNVAIQAGVDDAFTSGAEKGLASMFNDMAEAVRKLNPLFRIFGTILGKVVEVLGVIVNTVASILQPIITVVDAIMNVFRSSADGAEEMEGSVTNLTTALEFLGQALGGILVLVGGNAFVGFITTAAKAIRGIATTVRLWAAAQWSLNAAMLANPFAQAIMIAAGGLALSTPFIMDAVQGNKDTAKSSSTGSTTVENTFHVSASNPEEMADFINDTLDQSFSTSMNFGGV